MEEEIEVMRLTNKQKSGEAKNKNIARAGEAEVQTGKFGLGTKNREGVVPGSDGERRKNQAF